jgi:hypothetical protein
MASPVTPSKRVLANRENGRRGGLATAQKHGPEFCQARAQKAGLSVRVRYGSQYFSHIRKAFSRKRVERAKPTLPEPRPSAIPVQTTKPDVQTLSAALAV